MCHRMVPIPMKAVEEIIKDIENGLAVQAKDHWPAGATSAYPKSEVSLIVPHAEKLEAEVMKWGYAPSWSKTVHFNARAETAMRPEYNMWAESLHNRRCIIPAFGFYEPHQSETIRNPQTGKIQKQQYLFSSPTEPVLFIAGIHEDGYFSMMTTESCDLMRPIHNRMPVVLAQDEIDTWLHGDYASLFERGGVQLKAEKAAS